MQLKKELHRRLTDKKSKLLIGVVAFVFLVATPFLFYAYRLIPTSMESADVFGFTIEAGAHGNLNYYAYYFFTKLVLALSFTIWYITCRHWWKSAILVPICMLIFQILGIINTSVSYIDEFDFWYSVPVVLPIAVGLFYVSKKLRFYTMALDLKDEIEIEINSINSESKN